ncbi:MAG: hypothetical protein CNLJKLNK_00859 [Holosporales bacterium]
MQSAEEVPSLAFFSVNQEQYFKNLTEDSNFLSKINNETIENLFFYLRNLQSKNLLGEKALTTQEIETHLELEKETLERFTTQKTSVFAEKILLGMKRYYEKNSDYKRTIYLSQIKDRNFYLKLKTIIDLGKNKEIELNQKHEALELFKQAALYGDKDAEKFALILEASIAQTKKETLDSNALMKLKERAQSDSELMFFLYRICQSGTGGDSAASQEALAESIKWLKRAVDEGNKEALRALGVDYAHGTGVFMDRHEALKRLEQAALHGGKEAEKFALILKVNTALATKEKLDPNGIAQLKERAQSDIAFMLLLSKVYKNGIGEYFASSPEAFAESAKWLKRAIDVGNRNALKELGVSYYHGKGVPADKCEALKLFEKAARYSDKEAEKLALIVKAEISIETKETLATNVVEQLKVYAQSDAVLMMLLYNVYKNGLGEYPASSPEALAEEIKWLRCAADGGNTEALKELGIHYFYGKGVPVDKQKALNLFEQVAHYGDKDAEKYALIVKADISIETKETLATNIVEQLKVYAQSDVVLMMLLYKIYKNGLGEYPASSPEALAEEIKWLRCAADAGNRVALRELGILYYQGDGVPMDNHEALKLFEQAALCGDKNAEKYALIVRADISMETKETLAVNIIEQLKVHAQSDPALMMILYKVYKNGVGEYSTSSPETLSESIEWLKRAADAGNRGALKELGIRYVHGNGVPVDKCKAIKLLEQAAFLGDKGAEKLALIVKAGISIDTKETLTANLLEQLKEGAQSDPELMMLLYNVYKNGVGEYPASSPESLSESLKWLKRAVDVGNRDALKELGLRYYHGNGVPVDKHEALKFFEQAAHNGDKNAEKYALILKKEMAEAEKKGLDSKD